MLRGTSLVFNNKKGWFDIVLLVIILLFVFGMINLFVGKAFSNINSMIADDDDLSNTSKNITTQLESRYSGVMDGAFALVLALLLILCLFVSYQSTNSPFFKVVAIVVMVLLVVASLVLGAVYDGIVEDSELTSVFGEQPFTNWVLGNFGVVALIIIASMIAMMGMGSKYA